MLRNYLKIAYRNFFKHRLFSIINLIGLTVGLVVCLLIVLFVQDELSYDSFHENADRIMLFQQFENNSASGTAFAPLLDTEIAQVEKTLRLVQNQALIGTQEQSFYENGFYFADSTVFEVFDLPLLEGNPETALDAPTNLIISEAMAQKYFPNENPIGKTLEYGNEHTLNITGVMKDLPSNSHITIDFLSPYESIKTLTGRAGSGYWNTTAHTYLLLSAGTKPEEVAAQLPTIAEKTNDPNYGVWSLSVIPLRDIYLYHQLDGRLRAQNAIENVWIFSIIAIFILALACFNYVNLVTARSSTRAREVGMRKVLGARRQQLLLQFLSESGIMLAVSTVLALVVVQLILPTFNQFVGKELALMTLLDAQFILLFIAVFALVSLLTGSYPALVLSSFKPVSVLKNAFFGNTSDALFRKVLVSLQFAVSIVMIVATIVVANQLSFIQNKDLGYQRDHILTITFQGDVSADQKETFKRELQALASVKSITRSAPLPGQGVNNNKFVESYVPDGKDIGYSFLRVDEHFLETFDIQLKNGRFFDASSTPEKNQFVVNEAMVEYLEWEDGAIGKELGYYTYKSTPDGGYAEVPVTGEVIGVINDYHQSDLKTAIYPMVFKYAQGGEDKIAVNIAAGQIRNTVDAIQDKWTSFFPAEPFSYSFLDDFFDQTYARETKTAQVFGIFSGLAIFISCLGLLGLVAFAAERRTKEIGIRKVLGANLGNIIGLLSKDFVRLVIVAAFIAFPIAWWIMSQWLERFAYRVELSWWVFAIAGIATLLIALITISFQAIRAATANPAESLKTE